MFLPTFNNHLNIINKFYDMWKPLQEFINNIVHITSFLDILTVYDTIFEFLLIDKYY